FDGYEFCSERRWPDKATVNHTGYAKVLHIGMSSGDFKGDIDTGYRLANDIVCSRAFRFDLAGDVAIEMLSTNEIGIRDFLFRIPGVADPALSQCEPFYRHTQAHRSQR